MEEKQSKRHVLVKRAFMNVVEDEVILPNNTLTKRLFVMHPGASAILGFTKDGQIILTKQYRYPIGCESYEIPAGKIDNHEDPLTCAKRELEEETGYASLEYKLYQVYYPCVGYSNEILYIYLATNCEKVLNPAKQDSDEFVETHLVSLKQASQMLEQGVFKDSKTMIALQKYLLELFQNEKNKTR